MKKVLYIGQYTEGTTSRFRGESLKEIIKPEVFHVIDTNIPFNSAHKLIKTLGFRYKKGPLIKRVNTYILSNLKNSYDLIWVDKAVYITKKTTLKLKKITQKLVHFTPDPAFTFHKSKHFDKSIPYYDYLITTKSFEKEHYLDKVNEDKLIMTTQGYNKAIHKPYHSYEEKIFGIIFIGHNEKYRALILQELIDKGIRVDVAGINWDKFARKNESKTNFNYLGISLNGENYAKTISKYMFSIGFISKWIPEKHTTRTFEIPACGTILITEENEETKFFFNTEEVIFYNDSNDISLKLGYLKKHPEKLKEIYYNSTHKINAAVFDNSSILFKIVTKIETN